MNLMFHNNKKHSCDIETWLNINNVEFGKAE